MEDSKVIVANATFSAILQVTPTGSVQVQLTESSTQLFLLTSPTHVPVAELVFLVLRMDPIPIQGHSLQHNLLKPLLVKSILSRSTNLVLLAGREAKLLLSWMSFGMVKLCQPSGPDTRITNTIFSKLSVMVMMFLLSMVGVLLPGPSLMTSPSWRPTN